MALVARRPGGIEVPWSADCRDRRHPKLGHTCKMTGTLESARASQGACPQRGRGGRRRGNRRVGTIGTPTSPSGGFYFKDWVALGCIHFGTRLVISGLQFTRARANTNTHKHTHTHTLSLSPTLTLSKPYTHLHPPSPSPAPSYSSGRHALANMGLAPGGSGVRATAEENLSPHPAPAGTCVGRRASGVGCQYRPLGGGPWVWCEGCWRSATGCRLSGRGPRNSEMQNNCSAQFERWCHVGNRTKPSQVFGWAQAFGGCNDA